MPAQAIKHTHAHAHLPLCDRCAATLTDTGTPDVSQFRPRGARILVDKLAPVGADQTQRTATGLFVPAQHERVRQVYGIEAHVIAIGDAIDPADISVGDRVIIDEFAGRAVWWGDRVLPYWIVGDGEVMLAITDSAVSSTASTKKP